MKPEDKHADTILRVCSYQRHDFDLITVRSRPHVSEPVQNSLQTAFDTPPTLGLGGLDHLPEELKVMVIKNLDILSYFRFRRVNRYARILATEPREYQLVVKYGLEGLRGLLRSGCAQKCTIVDLLGLLTTQSCALCGDFGSFLFFLTATRCCFTCLVMSSKMCVISTTDFAKAAGISTRQLSRSFDSTLRTVSGRYCVDMSWMGQGVRPTKLILKKDAIAALAPQTVFKEYSIKNLLEVREDKSQRFMACTTFPLYNTRTGKFEQGVCCKGCQVRLEWSPQDFQNRDRVFSAAGFLIHFVFCIEAQGLWVQSKEGTRPVEETEFMRSGGYVRQWNSNLLRL